RGTQGARANHRTDPHSRNCSGEKDGAIGGLMADDLVQRLREHADREAGGGPGDATYDPETLALEHEAADEIDRMRAALREIRALHQPEWASEQAKAAGKEPWVCALCGTADGLWPCATVATIREVLGDE